jgi:two-component system, OmpR family, sensor histidine kinase CiaH
MFRSARLKLTLWYVLISMVISVAFSIILFSLIHAELGREYQRLEIREERLHAIDPFNNPPPQLNQQVLEGAENRLKLELLYANLLVLALSGLAGYFLAGRTLKPIQKMVQDQNRFIADASHELRTPLTALKTAIEVNLRDKKISLPQVKIVLKENLADVDNLKRLSDNLLSLASLQQSDYRQKKETVSLKKVIKLAMAKIIYLADKKNIEITSKIEEVSVIGDSNRLMEMVLIFLDNAIKYSSEKTTINIELKLINSLAEIVIKDEGIGINNKDLPHIFDRFYRADISRSKNKTDGYGLGLAIAKGIIVSHEGKVTVESQINKGTIFTIHLPTKK